jgi:hypothetical protein
VTTHSNVYEALSAVMAEVGAVSKNDYNQGQRFNFRGIDAVVNAVSPALRRHGVIVTPSVQSIDYGTVEVGQKRTPMGHVRLVVQYTFSHVGGGAVTATVPGEAMDSGDKATAKAMSVAFRTALLQALCLPTDEPDPDSQSYERSISTAVPEMDRDSFDRAMKAITLAADEDSIQKIEQALKNYQIRDEWVAALGEALTDWRVARA